MTPCDTLKNVDAIGIAIPYSAIGGVAMLDHYKDKGQESAIWGWPSPLDFSLEFSPVEFLKMFLQVYCVIE